MQLPNHLPEECAALAWRTRTRQKCKLGGETRWLVLPLCLLRGVWLRIDPLSSSFPSLAHCQRPKSCMSKG